MVCGPDISRSIWQIAGHQSQRLDHHWSHSLTWQGTGLSWPLLTSCLVIIINNPVDEATSEFHCKNYSIHSLWGYWTQSLYSMHWLHSEDLKDIYTSCLFPSLVTWTRDCYSTEFSIFKMKIWNLSQTDTWPLWYKMTRDEVFLSLTPNY